MSIRIIRGRELSPGKRITAPLLTVAGVIGGFALQAVDGKSISYSVGSGLLVASLAGSISFVTTRTEEVPSPQEIQS